MPSLMRLHAGAWQRQCQFLQFTACSLGTTLYKKCIIFIIFLQCLPENEIVSTCFSTQFIIWARKLGSKSFVQYPFSVNCKQSLGWAQPSFFAAHIVHYCVVVVIAFSARIIRANSGIAVVELSRELQEGQLNLNVTAIKNNSSLHPPQWCSGCGTQTNPKAVGLNPSCGGCILMELKCYRPMYCVMSVHVKGGQNFRSPSLRRLS